MSKFSARLPMSFLLNYELNDQVVVFNRAYRINSIQTNLTTGISKLELINAPEAQVDFKNDEALYVNIDSELGKVDTVDVSIDQDSFNPN